MSAIGWGVVQTAPDGDGYGVVVVGDTARRTFFDPLRWGVLGGLPQAVAGDRVAVISGYPQAVALWPLGAGTPTGIPGGAWS